ncbi:peroxisomal biogenesis factor 2 [Panaeolus papilionaceus]|nr:peroxisomal biogenesis factor 2 [Panaeolus papilionaceus]
MSSSTPSTHSSALGRLEDVWRSVQPKLSEILQNLNPTLQNEGQNKRIIRVGQLDAELLDQELAHVLHEPINKALSLVNIGIKAYSELELRLFIQLVLYKFAIWDTGASYGAKLQDLRYVVPQRNSNRLTPSGLPRKTLIIHGALTHIVPYLHARLRTHALSQAWPDAPSSDIRRKAWDTLHSVESIYTALGLVNFVAFLWNGRYRTLADRLLMMKLVPSRRLVKRDVSYEFMNRQMVWHAFTEFLLFALPLLNARSVRRRVSHLLTKFSPKSIYAIAFPTSAAVPKSSKPLGKYASLPPDQCAICAENAARLDVSKPANIFQTLWSDSSAEAPAYPINNPYQTSCGHIYCYQCIAERMLHNADDGGDESGWLCLRCSEGVINAQRYMVEVTGSEMTESDYDFSSDLDLGTDLSGSMGSYTESAFSE